MAPLGVVFKKEVKENFRDWRTILPALIIGPIVSPLLIGFMFSFMLKQVSKDTSEPLKLPVVGAEHAPNLMDFLGAHQTKVTTDYADREAAIAAVKDRTADVVLIVPSTIKDDLSEGVPAPLELVADLGRRNTLKEYRRARSLLEAYSRQLGSMRLFARGIDPNVIRPIVVDEVDVSTPSGRSVILLGMVTYIVLFAVLMGGLPITNDSTAGERERKSLEPLLTTPIRRAQLVLEKIGAAAFFMTLALALCLTVMSLGLGAMPLEQVGMRSSFGPAEAGLAFVILLPFVVFGAGLMSIVASFTKTYKEAQTYLGVVILVPTMPIIFAGVADLKPDFALMFVPSLSQHFLILSLIGGDPIVPLHLVVSAATTLLTGVIAIMVAVRLYQREGLLG